MKTMWALIFAVCVVLAIAHYGCDTPYSGPLGPEDFNGWIESEENGVICLWNGFESIANKVGIKNLFYLSNFKHITSKAREAFVLVLSIRDLVSRTTWMACCIRSRE